MGEKNTSREIFVINNVGKNFFNISVFYHSIDKAIVSDMDYFRVQTLQCMEFTFLPQCSSYQDEMWLKAASDL